MKFLSHLFGSDKKQESTKMMLFEGLTKLENLFSDEILKNPNVGKFDPSSYKSFAYNRCAYYQEQLANQKKEIEKVLATNDGTLSDGLVQSTNMFLTSVIDGAKAAAKEFYAILDEGDGQSEDVKREQNKKCYDLSVEKRALFLKMIEEFKEKCVE